MVIPVPSFRERMFWMLLAYAYTILNYPVYLRNFCGIGQMLQDRGITKAAVESARMISQHEQLGYTKRLWRMLKLRWYYAWVRFLPEVKLKKQKHKIQDSKAFNRAKHRGLRIR